MNMRRQFLSMLKVQLKLRFSFNALKGEFKSDRAKTLKKAGMTALILLAVVYLLGIWTFISFGLMASAVIGGMGELMLGMLFLASAIVVLVFSIAGILGLIFSAKDVEFLSSMPVPQWMVFGSKLAVLYLSEFATMLAFAGPAAVIYGILTGMNVFFYIKTLIAILFLPLIPLCAASLICLVLFRFAAHFRHRSLITSILGFAAIIGIVFLQAQFQRIMVQSRMSPEFIADILKDAEGLISTFTSFFPPAGWAVFFMTGSALTALLNFVYLLIACTAALFIVLATGNALFYKGALSMLENRGGGSKKINVKASAPVMLSVFRKEWKIILRTPVYLINSLSGVIIFPLMLIVMPMMSGSDPELAGLDFTILLSFVPVRFMILITAAVMLLIGAINVAVSTSVSREGSSLNFLKSFPISPKNLVLGKFWMGQSIALLGIIVMGVCLSFAMKFPVELVLISSMLAFILSFAATAISIIPDILRPKLRWNSEQEAMKQNMNSLMAMGLSVVYLGVLTGCVFLVNLLPVNDIIYFAVLTLLAAGLDVLFMRLMLKTAKNKLLAAE